MVEILKETKDSWGDTVQLVVNEKGNYSRRVVTDDTYWYQYRYGKDKERALNEWEKSFENK